MLSLLYAGGPGYTFYFCGQLPKTVVHHKKPKTTDGAGKGEEREVTSPDTLIEVVQRLIDHKIHLS